MTRKSYKKYKNSGIEWLGKVPEHWEIKKIKYISQIITGKTPPKNDIDNYAFNGVMWIKPDNLSEFIPISKTKEYLSDKGVLTTKLIPGYSPLICCIGNIGKLGFSKHLATTNQQINAIVFNYQIINKKFGLYLCFSLKQEFQRYSNLNVVWILTSDKQKQIFCPKVEMKEQESIANFLDKETSRIDSLIQKKEKQTELLKEKRSALIAQAVTKGLNSNVKMKDSGVEWLGKIPEHWEIKKIKFISNSNPSNIDKKSKEGEKEIFLCNYVDVYKNEYINNTFYFMKATATIDQISKFVLRKGDVIVTKDSEVRNDIAVPALVTKDFDNVVCGYHLTHIKPKKILGDYLFRCFQSKWLQSYFEISTNGITRYGISVDKFNSALILIPTRKEQKAIADFLDKETSRTDSLTEKIKQSIKLLKEYRSALITSAVTGQIDVRESQLEIANIVPLQKSKEKSLGPSEKVKPTLIARTTSTKGDSQFIRKKKPVFVAKKASKKSASPIFKKTALGAKIVA